jgi:predicted dehydrogenase
LSQLKVGIAGLRRGLGYLQHVNHYRYADARVTAVYDPLQNRMAAAAEAHGTAPCASFEQLLETDVDLVVLASPPAAHAQQTIAAVSAGKHVLCEVPAATTLDDACAVVEAVERSGVKYMMSENGNFEGFVRAWHRLVREGRLGTIIYGEGEYIHDLRHTMLADAEGNWVASEDRDTVEGARPTWRASFPPILYIPHPLGPLLYTLGNDRAVTVSAMSSGSFMASELRDGAPDMQVAILKTAGGALLRCTVAYAVERESPLTNWQSVYGTEGAIEWKRAEWDTPKAWFKDLHGWQRGAGRPDMVPIDWSVLSGDEAPPEARGFGEWGDPDPASRYDADWFVVHHILQAILNDTTPPIDVHRAMDYSVPGICANVSAERGGDAVEIPDLRRVASS